MWDSSMNCNFLVSRGESSEEDGSTTVESAAVFVVGDEPLGNDRVVALDAATSLSIRAFSILKLTRRLCNASEERPSNVDDIGVAR